MHNTYNFVAKIRKKEESGKWKEEKIQLPIKIMNYEL